MLKAHLKNKWMFALLIFVGCNYNQQKKSDIVPEGFRQIEFTTGSELSYQQINDHVIAPKCLECHSNAGGNKGRLNLENYRNVFANKEGIRESILDKSMPKDRPPLNEYEIRLVVAWIESGASELAQRAPEPVVVPAEPPAEPPVVVPPVIVPPVGPIVPPQPEPVVVPDIELDQIDFSIVTKYVLQTNCYKCHSDAGGNKGQVNLETYANVMDNLSDVKFDIEMDMMPLAPPKGIPLTDAQKKLILSWIENGAPEKAKPADPTDNIIELEQIKK